MNPEVIYLPDDSVDDELDRELRTLLTTCFTKPQDIVFRERRYFCEPYPHRWIIKQNRGVTAAHIGVHEKKIVAGGQVYPVGGICEVCVHPDFRSRGYVHHMLKQVHAWLDENTFAFSVLFGDPAIYRSSGYEVVDNLVHGSEEGGWKPIKAMTHALSPVPWPSGEVRLPGPQF